MGDGADRAEEVGRELSLPVGHVELLEPPAHGEAGVGDDDVELAELGDHLCDGGGRVVGDVAHHGQGLGAGRLDLGAGRLELGRRRPEMATAAPARAKASARALPMPEPPPVIQTT